MDLQNIYKNLEFLEEPLRLRYTNFIYKYYEKAKGKTSLNEVYERLSQDEPIEYVLNIGEFYGNEFYVDNRVLIPRPETEEIIDITLKYIQERPNEDFTVIDVGTGSGCIVLSIALEAELVSKRAEFIGIDVSKEAIEVAKINRASLKLADNVKLQSIDFRDFNFSNYPNLIVLANLPYIPNSRNLQPSVTNYEPHLALFGGQDGDELIIQLKKILEKLPNLRLLITEEDNGKINVSQS